MSLDREEWTNVESVHKLLMRQAPSQNVLALKRLQVRRLLLQWTQISSDRSWPALQDLHRSSFFWKGARREDTRLPRVGA